MKEILNDKIINIKDTQIFDNKFLFRYLNTTFKGSDKVEVFFMQELLAEKKNKELFDSIKDRYSIYMNVYSEKDELEIFNDLFEYAIKNNKKIHIIGITLDKEVKILEEYYEKLGFLREDINCFSVDFELPLITVGVNIENLMWRGSDYKKMKDKIYFIPPIREAGQTKAMFKGINRGVIANINIKELTDDKKLFLKESIQNEHILPLTMGKVLYFNIKNFGFEGDLKNIVLDY